MTSRNPKFEWIERLHEAKGLTVTTRFIGDVLAERYNGDGKPAFMSNDEIVERTGVSLSVVKRARKALVDAGWVTVLSRGGRSGDGATRATSYTLTIPERPRQGWGAAARGD